jgi:hypothetical protein
LDGEEVKKGYFIVVCYTQSDFDKIKDIEEIVQDINKRRKVNMKVIVVDATTPKASASNL